MNNIFKYRLYGRSKGRGKINTISNDAIKLRLKKIDPLNYNVLATVDDSSEALRLMRRTLGVGGRGVSPLNPPRSAKQRRA